MITKSEYLALVSRIERLETMIGGKERKEKGEDDKKGDEKEKEKEKEKDPEPIKETSFFQKKKKVTKKKDDE